MTDIQPGWIALVVVAVGVFGTGGYFAQRGRNRNDTIDQYQEDRAADRTRMDKQDTRIEAQDAKIHVLLVREISMRNYVLQLTRHIDEGRPPPPPPMPSELMP